jgi:hypothetical protein
MDKKAAQTLALIMTCRPIAQTLMLKIREEATLAVIFELAYASADTAIRANSVDTALVEVAEAGQFGLCYCLALCARIRRKAPRCKLMLMCPESDEEGVARVVEAKRCGQIDDFVFYDSTIDYLASKLLSM